MGISKKIEKGMKAFVMQVEEVDDSEEEDDNSDENGWALVTIGARFSLLGEASGMRPVRREPLQQVPGVHRCQWLAQMSMAYCCGGSVVYCMVGDHCLVRPHEPCRCPEPGCSFLDPSLVLRGHEWPVTDVAYVSMLEVEVQMQPAQRSCGGGPERLFLLVASKCGVMVVQVQGVGAHSRGHGH
ncbi:uncharacterized protein LOC125531907 isoform X2 [Triticum urartu]|uniref:uncharacterized protein LOC125531907 isoform X2 n=1 Tax=Triticum urartu TaxID=4572 RepID=UPI0020443DB5|nr:uncharacterized protein LOC125531907 isoform X2 [Triticum urartu]XP_048552087.1 uncharacterized protein LOC125531907 isoform X2 [Triticum urartu]